MDFVWHVYGLRHDVGGEKRLNPSGRRLYPRETKTPPRGAAFRIPDGPELFLWQRRDHHHHLTAFELRHGFDLAVDLHLFGDPVELLAAKIHVGHFAATEAQGDLHLVAALQELDRIFDLAVEVVVIGARTDFDFFDFDDFLVLTSFGFTLLLLVFELTVVHDLADGRRGGGGNFHQIKPGFFSHCQCAIGRNDADVLAVGADQADVRAANAFVDPGAGFARGRSVVRSASYGTVPSMVGDSRAATYLGSRRAASHKIGGKWLEAKGIPLVPSISFNHFTPAGCPLSEWDST